MKMILFFLALVISLTLGNIQVSEESLSTQEEQKEYNAHIGVFAAIMAPLAIIIGFATASVGFTCWSIVVPLLWVGFEIDVYDSLFTSIATDCINSARMTEDESNPSLKWLTFLVLTAIYAYQGRVVFKEGTMYGLVSAGFAVGCMFGAKWVIDRFKDYLKRGLGYVIIVISFSFLSRG